MLYPWEHGRRCNGQPRRGLLIRYKDKAVTNFSSVNEKKALFDTEESSEGVGSVFFHSSHFGEGTSAGCGADG